MCANPVLVTIRKISIWKNQFRQQANILITYLISLLKRQKVENRKLILKVHARTWMKSTRGCNWRKLRNSFSKLVEKLESWRQRGN